MNKKDIIKAYTTIRKINKTIPDEVLDFMKDSALNALNESQTPTINDEVNLINKPNKTLYISNVDGNNVLVRTRPTRGSHDCDEFWTTLDKITLI